MKFLKSYSIPNLILLGAKKIILSELYRMKLITLSRVSYLTLVD